ncbi:putative membrane protein [Aerococcus sp. 150760007-1]
MEMFFTNLLEFFYILIGLQFAFTSYKVLRSDQDKRIGTALFWFDLAILFALGKWLPAIISGALVLLLAIITLVKHFVTGKFEQDEERAEAGADRFGNLVFVPVIVMAITALALAQFVPASGAGAIGIGAIVALVLAMAIFRAPFQQVLHESNRNVQQVGSTAILPQLLAALGVIFVNAGVGEIVTSIFGNLVPEGNQFLGATMYVIAMVVFTMIMGNAFAAFTVITAGIGIPFVIMQGANPAIAGALAMTAGYCGTLLTPMAGNFNALPVALLEMKSEYGVIKRQAPIAIALIVVHIVLMYTWAF